MEVLSEIPLKNPQLNGLRIKIIGTTLLNKLVYPNEIRYNNLSYCEYQKHLYIQNENKGTLSLDDPVHSQK